MFLFFFYLSGSTLLVLSVTAIDDVRPCIKEGFSAFRKKTILSKRRKRPSLWGSLSTRIRKNSGDAHLQFLNKSQENESSTITRVRYKRPYHRALLKASNFDFQLRQISLSVVESLCLYHVKSCLVWSPNGM